MEADFVDGLFIGIEGGQDVAFDHVWPVHSALHLMKFRENVIIYSINLTIIVRYPRGETRVCYPKPAKARLPCTLTTGRAVRFNAAFLWQTVNSFTGTFLP